jgi:predicted nucleotidyltransferase component of viral defense system
MSPPDRGRAESIRQRLRNLMRERGEDAQFGLQRYAIERFLYRLGVSAHRDRFILKGAALFALWGGAAYRATRDVDFTGYGSSDEAEVLAAFREICEIPSPSDELILDGTTLTAEPIRDESEYPGFRVKLEARLGDSRIPVQIDLGFGNAIQPPPQIVTYPTLLDDPAPRIQAYPLEAVVAEKFHAMVLLGDRNSRFKDFYDLHVLARQFPFEGEPLAKSIAATFAQRRTEITAVSAARSRCSSSGREWNRTRTGISTCAAGRGACGSYRKAPRSTYGRASPPSRSRATRSPAERLPLTAAATGEAGTLYIAQACYHS